MKKQRIDNLLIERGLAESPEKARALVMAGVVLNGNRRIDKPSETVSVDADLRIKGGGDHNYVGRGGLKLEKALDKFHIRPTGYVCLDIGASTGGFTDCLLQRGASRVVAVDSGTNQLDWKLRSDPRVDVRENTTARFLKPDDFDSLFDLIVMDVSFISAKAIMPVIPALLKPGSKAVVLIKPQFEVAKYEVGEGGIVRDAALHERVVSEVNMFAASVGLRPCGLIESPILGMEGNKEFLALYERA